MTDTTPPTVAQHQRHCFSCGAPSGAHLSWCPTLIMSSGIHLWDYFALEVLKALIAKQGLSEDIVSVSCQIADDMLKSRGEE